MDGPVSDPTLFDRRAEIYARARPPYPAAMYARLRSLDVLRAEARVLELGAGTGQATEAFVAAGAIVTAVEPGPTLANRLVERFPSITVVAETAEAVALDGDAYDVVISATAFHWLDLDIVLPAIHRALVPSGTLAVWWTVFGDPDVDTPFRRRVTAIVDQRQAPNVRSHGPLDTESWLGSLTAGGHFTAAHTEQIRWQIDLNALQIRDLFSTFSGWSEQEVGAVRHAVVDLGGTVTEHYVTALYVLHAT
jgi:SAM-dependent methyltransferase